MSFTIRYKKAKLKSFVGVSEKGYLYLSVYI